MVAPAMLGMKRASALVLRLAKVLRSSWILFQWGNAHRLPVGFCLLAK